MPKKKTRKAVAKRFKITSKKKIMRRRSKQNHFNARQTPKKKRQKRNDHEVAKKFSENILIELPYN